MFDFFAHHVSVTINSCHFIKITKKKSQNSEIDYSLIWKSAKLRKKGYNFKNRKNVVILRTHLQIGNFVQQIDQAIRHKCTNIFSL